MILKEYLVFISNDKLLRSNVSPWGENKRGELLQGIPPHCLHSVSGQARQRGKSSLIEHFTNHFI